jgi:hypothetical protein
MIEAPLLHAYTCKEVASKIKKALAQVIEKDAFLLQCSQEGHVHEISIAHRLAVYLEPQFPEYNVDCAYNRHAINSETLKSDEKGGVRPSIIVHARGLEEYNLLVIELEAADVIPVEGAAEKRLKALTRRGKTAEFGYRYGLFVGFSGLGKPALRGYEGGKASEQFFPKI